MPEGRDDRGKPAAGRKGEPDIGVGEVDDVVIGRLTGEAAGALAVGEIGEEDDGEDADERKAAHASPCGRGALACGLGLGLHSLGQD